MVSLLPFITRFGSEESHHAAVRSARSQRRQQPFAARS